MTFSLYSGPPKVFPIGVTQPIEQGFLDFIAEREITYNRDVPFTTASVAAFSGASCYDSFHNPANRTDAEYLQQQIVTNKHESVIEHVVINFAVCHLPRSSQMELIRHRVGVAYSFRSQRFTDSWLEFIVPPLIREQNQEVFESYERLCRSTYAEYERLAEAISADPLGEHVEGTLRRKRVKEAARAILGNNVGSDGVVSMNARALRHIIKMRSDEHAEAGIREFAYALYDASFELLTPFLIDLDEEEISFGPPQIGDAHA